MLHYFIKVDYEFKEVSASEFFGYVHTGLMYEKHGVYGSSSTYSDFINFTDSHGSCVAFMSFDN